MLQSVLDRTQVTAYIRYIVDCRFDLVYCSRSCVNRLDICIADAHICAVHIIDRNFNLVVISSRIADLHCQAALAVSKFHCRCFNLASLVSDAANSYLAVCVSQYLCALHAVCCIGKQFAQRFGCSFLEIVNLNLCRALCLYIVALCDKFVCLAVDGNSCAFLHFLRVKCKLNLGNLIAAGGNSCRLCCAADFCCLDVYLAAGNADFIFCITQVVLQRACHSFRNRSRILDITYNNSLVALCCDIVRVLHDFVFLAVYFDNRTVVYAFAEFDCGCSSCLLCTVNQVGIQRSSFA